MPTPEQWRDRLSEKLRTRWVSGVAHRPGMSVFDAYYEGDHDLHFATRVWREAFGALFSQIADNWCPIVVDSSAERLEVQGFRFGDSEEADDDAWEIWQANQLDSLADQNHTEAIKLGEGYWLVEPGDPPKITAEHASQVIVAYVSGSTYDREAALKQWSDDDGTLHANVYLPDRIYKWEARKRPDGLWLPGLDQRRLEWRSLGSVRNPLGEVPVVPLCNNPSLLYGGRSDLQDVIPLQNAINKTLSDMLIGQEFQAFPQRVLLGVDVPLDENGAPVPAAQLKASKSRLWAFPGDASTMDVKEFNASDLQNYTAVKQSLVRDLAATTRTPPHYVLGEIVNASGDALKAAEAGLTAKVKKKMRAFGEGHEETMRLAFRAMGDSERAEAIDAEVMWRDPENRSEAEMVDGAVKKDSIGVPFEQLMEDLGYSPKQIERMQAMKEVDDLLAPPTAPPPTGATPAPTQGGPTVPETPAAPPTVPPAAGRPPA